MDPGWDELELRRARAEDRVLFEMSRGMARGRLTLGRAAAAFIERGGPERFGFSSFDAYAREQLSRRGRWVSDCARLAQRLAKLPTILAAYEEGRLSSPSMAELLVRHATAETEAELLDLALMPGVTVHAMREFLGCDPPDQEDESERCDVSEMLRFEHSLLVEATRMAIEHLDGSDYEFFESLVGEGFSTRPELFNGELMPEVWIEQMHASERMCAGVEERRQREELAEPNLPVNEVEPGEFPDEPIPTDIRALDALMRRTSMRLASHDLVLGRAAIDFFHAARWRRLGYGTDRQYCEERLGMARTPVLDRTRLARRCKKLPALAEAVSTMSIGFESACLLARHVTPRTESDRRRGPRRGRGGDPDRRGGRGRRDRGDGDPDRRRRRGRGRPDPDLRRPERGRRPRRPRSGSPRARRSHRRGHAREAQAPPQGRGPHAMAHPPPLGARIPRRSGDLQTPRGPSPADRGDVRTLCERGHLRNIHELGSLQVFGNAPDDLTFVFGEVPHFVVRGREKRPAA